MVVNERRRGSRVAGRCGESLELMILCRLHRAQTGLSDGCPNRVWDELLLRCLGSGVWLDKICHTVPISPQSWRNSLHLMIDRLQGTHVTSVSVEK